MPDVDIKSELNKSRIRDYLELINEPEFPKAKTAQLAKK